jgi:hypothetical protein
VYIYLIRCGKAKRLLILDFRLLIENPQSEKVNRQK